MEASELSLHEALDIFEESGPVLPRERPVIPLNVEGAETWGGADTATATWAGTWAAWTSIGPVKRMGPVEMGLVVVSGALTGRLSFEAGPEGGALPTNQSGNGARPAGGGAAGAAGLAASADPEGATGIK
jgi:hypothetical protein